MRPISLRARETVRLRALSRGPAVVAVSPASIPDIPVWSGAAFNQHASLPECLYESNDSVDVRRSHRPSFDPGGDRAGFFPAIRASSTWRKLNNRSLVSSSSPVNRTGLSMGYDALCSFDDRKHSSITPRGGFARGFGRISAPPCDIAAKRTARKPRVEDAFPINQLGGHHACRCALARAQAAPRACRPLGRRPRALALPSPQRFRPRRTRRSGGGSRRARRRASGRCLGRGGLPT